MGRKQLCRKIPIACWLKRRILIGRLCGERRRVQKIFTESSARFTRGVDRQGTIAALARVWNLLQQFCPTATFEGFGDTWTSDPALQREIVLPLRDIERCLGLALETSVVLQLLTRAGLSARHVGGALYVTVGSEREDLQASCDVLEEIVRMYGYDAWPTTFPTEPIPVRPVPSSWRDHARVREVLLRLGLHEFLSYTMTSPELEARWFGAEKTSYVRLVNPISEERRVLRQSLLPALLQTVAENQRFQTAIHAFELGPVFFETINPYHAK